MTHLVCGTTLTDAWLRSLEYLLGHEREAYDLVVTVEDPSDQSLEHPVVRVLDSFLHSREMKDVREVRNTIFPANLAETCHDRQELYERYTKILPTLKRLRGNKKGLYFERLIHYPLQTREDRWNQVETVIQDLRQQLERRDNPDGPQGPLRSVYEAQIFAPGKDRLPMGFPCMSSLSFQLERLPRLRLTATYRNQYYIQRALGNLFGLAALQSFVAREAGVEPGGLTMHAFRASIDPEIGMSAARTLLADCREALQQT